jgi:hypothetical protein
MRCQEPEEIRQLLRDGPQELVDSDRLMKVHIVTLCNDPEIALILFQCFSLRIAVTRGIP